MVKNKSFTLIELLIVIGILAILVVTILITLNPSEAQKKTRDAKRMKDLATLQSIVLQWINDGNTPFCTNGCNSQYAPPNSQPCNSNWLGANLCNYTNTIPTDPLNGQVGTYIVTSTNPISTRTGSFFYQMIMKGSDYEIDVLQESKSNAGNILYSDIWVAAGSCPSPNRPLWTGSCP